MTLKRVYVNEEDWNAVMDYAKRRQLTNRTGRITFAEALKKKLEDTGW